MAKKVRNAQGIVFKHNPPRVVNWGAVSSGVQAQDDKDSMAEQFRTLREHEERQGWEVVDEILIPGFSRDFYTYEEFCVAAEKAGITDPRKMFKHWQDQDVDIIACVNFSRLGREEAIIQEFVGRTYGMGSFIYTAKNGLIPPEQRRHITMIEAYSSKSEIDEFVRRRHFGMKKRGSLGLQTGKMSYMHRYTYNPNGDPVKTRGADGNEYYITVDRERVQPLLDDLYEVFVHDRTGYQYLARELEARGHQRGGGKRFNYLFFADQVWNPLFWGHISYGVTGRGGHRRWLIDPAHADERPPNSEMYYNVVEPCYTGERAERFRSEMYRRMMFQGGTAHKNRWRFSGLVYCARCGNVMGIRGKATATNRFYQCMRYFRRKHDWSDLPPCDHKTFLRSDTIQAYLEAKVFPALQSPQREAFIRNLYAQPQQSRPNHDRQLTAVQSQIDTLQANMSDPAFPTAAREDAFRNMERLYADRARLTKMVEVERLQTHAADDHLAVLEHLDLAAEIATLWDKPEQEINQRLFTILRGARLFALEGQVVGLGVGE